MESKINLIYRFLIPILVVGVSLGFTVFPMCLALLVIRILVSGKQNICFYLIMYGGVIGGLVRTMYPFIPIYGMVLTLLGVILAFDRLREMLRNDKKSIVILLVLYLVFTLYYFLGPRDEFAVNKLTGIYQVGVYSLLGYYIFCTSEKINNESLFQILVLSTLLMLAFVIQYYGFSRGPLFDYEWFRTQEYAYAASNHFEDGTLISYQHIAMNMLFGFAIYLSQKTIANKWLLLVYTLSAGQLIMMSGCRQAILGFLVVVILRMSFFREGAAKKSFRVLTVMLILLIMSYLFLSSLNVEFIAETFQSGDEGRKMLMTQGIMIFMDNVVMGSGLGGYHAITGEVYPHNFFIEVLCECGLFGVLMFSLILVYCFRQNKVSLRYTTTNGSYLFLVLAALFVRICVSGDFTQSTELFSAIFATLALTDCATSNNKS